MSKRLWLLVIGVVTAGLLATGHLASVQAQSAADTETLARANQLYENGRFQEAAQTYQQLVDKGIANATLSYNLANAAYKSGDLGRAILNYERAAQLAPRDADIRANLEMARAQIVDKYEAGGSGWLDRLAALNQAWLTLNETAVLTLVLWLLLAASILFYRHSRREALQYALILTSLLFLASLLALGGRVYVEANRPQAIVQAAQVDILSGPGTQYITEFSLHSGAKVSLLERRGSWVRLALPGEQLQGWADAGSVAAITPGS